MRKIGTQTGKLYTNKKVDRISFSNSQWHDELKLYVEQSEGEPQVYEYIREINDNTGKIVSYTSIERVKSLEERIEALESAILSLSLKKE